MYWLWLLILLLITLRQITDNLQNGDLKWDVVGLAATYLERENNHNHCFNM